MFLTQCSTYLVSDINSPAISPIQWCYHYFNDAVKYIKYRNNRLVSWRLSCTVGISSITNPFRLVNVVYERPLSAKYYKRHLAYEFLACEKNLRNNLESLANVLSAEASIDEEVLTTVHCG